MGYGINSLDYRVVIEGSGGRYNFLLSDWLQWTFETGAIGLILAACFAGMLAWRAWRAWPEGREHIAPAFMLLGLSLISIPFRIGPVAFLGALYLGRLYAETCAATADADRWWRDEWRGTHPVPGLYPEFSTAAANPTTCMFWRIT